MNTTKEFLTRQLFERTMISCFKSNFKIEMSFPPRKTQQLWRLFHFSFFHILLDLILKGKKGIKEKIAYNTEENLLQNKQLCLFNHKENIKATPNLFLAEEEENTALSWWSSPLSLLNLENDPSKCQ